MKARSGQVFHHSKLELIVFFMAPTPAPQQRQIKAAALAPLKMLGSELQPWYNVTTQMLKNIVYIYFTVIIAQ